MFNRAQDVAAARVAAPDHDAAELYESEPGFVRDLGRDAGRARLRFLELGYRYLMARPLPVFRGLPDWSTHEVVVEVLIHFVDNDLRQLRKYRPQGRPFVAWLRVGADHKVRELIRRQAMQRRKVQVNSDIVNRVAGHTAAARAEADVLLREKLVSELESFRGTPCYCLLEWRLRRGYDNQEIARMLRRPEANAEVGNRYRRCLGRLQKRLARTGILREVPR